MTMLTSDSTLPLAPALVVKATALLGIANMLQFRLFRQESAATSHLDGTIAYDCVLQLPVIVLVGPAWTIEIPAVPGRVSATLPPLPVDPGSEMANPEASPVAALESAPTPARTFTISSAAALVLVHGTGAMGLL